jgi:hypothetical protein
MQEEPGDGAERDDNRLRVLEPQHGGKRRKRGLG